MLERLRTFFRSKQKLVEAEKEILRLRIAVKELEEKTAKPKPVILVDQYDPDKISGENRKMYVADIAGFHRKYLAPKILRMIADIREELSRVDGNRQLDDVLRGTENALWLFHDWGESMVNEQLSYGEELSDAEISNLKDKLE